MNTEKIKESNTYETNYQADSPQSIGEDAVCPPEPCIGQHADNDKKPIKGDTTGLVARDTYHKAARQWFEFGCQVIPVVPETKQPAIEWDDWLDSLSPATLLTATGSKALIIKWALLLVMA